MNSPAYETAYEASRVAARKWMEVQRAYRAREIDDAAYLAARSEWKVSEAEFDAAFAAEQERQSA
jgi:hypothetical protein